MKVLSKSWVLFLLIAAAMPVFATRPFTLAGRTNGNVANPNYPFISFGSSVDGTQRLFRTGGTNGTCDTPVAAPTQANVPGTFTRRIFGLGDQGDQCITVKLHGVSTGNRYSVAAYSTLESDPKIGLLGYSRDWVEHYGDVQFFSFRKPPSGFYYLVFYGIQENADFTYYVEISSSLAVSSDFDGDGRTDSTVFRPSTGTWYILRSSDSTVAVDFFGSNGDVPLDGDFDGDGKSDLAVFRPSNGTWYYKRSYNGTFFGAFFGLGTDKPVPGDYDKDSITDIGAFRDGQWLISPSSGGAPHTSVTGYAFGAPGDIPVGSQRK